MVLEDQPAAVEEEESDDEAIDMEVSTTFIFVKNDVFLFLLLSFTLKNSSLQDFVESGKLEEDTGVVEPTVEVFLINILGKQLFLLYFFCFCLSINEAAQAAQGGEILSTRTYDLNITYDKYYQVLQSMTIALKFVLF